MEDSSPDRKTLKIRRALGAAAILMPAAPLLATSSLMTYVRLRYRGAGFRKKDDLDTVVRYDPSVRTMSEVMEILRAVPFKKAVPDPLARTANWLIKAVPATLEEVRGLSGLIYPYPEAFKPVIVESRDGTPLSGVLAVQPSQEPRPALLLVHGLFASKNAFNIQALALRAYYDWGFHVYAMDLRNCGDSSRLSEAPTSLGYRESDDVAAVVEYLESMSRVTTVGLCGIGMGGGSALMAAGRSGMSGRIDGGIAALNCYADARRAVDRLSRSSTLSLRSFTAVLALRLMMSMKTLTGGPRPIGDLRSYAREVAAQYYEVSEEELYRRASPVRVIGEMEVPCLLVHSLDDRVVSVAETYDLLAASVDNPMVDGLIVPSGGHAAYQLSCPGWFHETLKTFFTYWARSAPEGGQPAGTTGTDTIGTFDNPNN